MADPLGPSILAVFFLFLSAMVYALNAALPSADESELSEQAEEGSPAARRLLRLLHRYDEGYGEIRLTYVSLLLAAFALLSCSVPDSAMSWLPLAEAPCALLMLCVYAIVAYALTAIIPGSIAAHAPEQTLKITAAPVEWTVLALSVLTRPAYLLGKLVLSPFGIRPGIPAEHVTKDEIRMMVDIGEEKGTIEADEKEMIENIFEFNSMNAEDCMVHRKDITAIDIEATPEEILAVIEESGRSRLPVYEDSIDNIHGILFARDFLINRCSGAPKDLKDLVRPAYFVPESVRTDVLFREMQTRKQHMSIVVDEYGGTSGLITLEDLLEEIVGNIYDEFDPKEEQDVTALPDGRWRVSGSVDLETLADAIDAELPLDEEYDTLGGLVFSHMNEIPADGQRPVVECFGLRISVTEIADRRVEWAILEKLPDETSDEDNESNPRRAEKGRD